MTPRTGRFWIKKTRRAEHDGPDRAVLLCRQSITRGETVSLDDQEERNRTYADSHGYRVVDVHRSPNVRGWAEERHDHDAIRALAKAGRVDVVVSYDVSRTARTVRLLENLAHDLEAHGVRLEFSAQEFANTAQGRQLLGLFAESETAARSIRLSDVWAHLRARGHWHGKAPLGYRRQDKSLVIDAAYEPLVRQVFDWAMSGKGTTWIANELHTRGTPTREGGTWSQAHLSRLLRNPAYAGGMRIDGEAVFPPPGVTWHPPYLSRDEWDHLQRMLPDRPLVVRRKPIASWLEGHVEHACGRRMHLVSTTTPRPGEILPLFRCANVTKPPRCTIVHRELSARNLETAARDALLRDLASARSIDEIQTEAARQRTVDGTTMARKRIVTARAALEREKRTTDALLRADDVAEDDKQRLWKEGMQRIRRESAVLDAEESALPDPLDISRLMQTADILRGIAAYPDELTPDDLAFAMQTLGIVAVTGPGGVRMTYPAYVAEFIPSPVTVPVPRAHKR